jgi:hypothetical protein
MHQTRAQLLAAAVHRRGAEPRGRDAGGLRILDYFDAAIAIAVERAGAPLKYLRRYLSALARRRASVGPGHLSAVRHAPVSPRDRGSRPSVAESELPSGASATPSARVQSEGRKISAIRWEPRVFAPREFFRRFLPMGFGRFAEEFGEWCF